MGASADLAPERRRRLEYAALRAIVYAGLFEYPLTIAEITRYLPDERATCDEIAACLIEPQYVGDHIACRDGYYCQQGTEHFIATRVQRAADSAVLWRQARRIGRLLSLWPFIRMVAVSGSLAASNWQPGHDIDLFIVTTRGRVWLTRMVVIALGRVLPGGVPCPNFVVSEDAMALVYRDFYAARELAQIVPLYGSEVYQQLMTLNAWIRDYLPNADPMATAGGITDGAVRRRLRTVAGWIANRCGAALVESWQRRTQIERARVAGWLGAPGVILDEGQCKAHAKRHHASVTERFTCALARLELDTSSHDETARSGDRSRGVAVASGPA